MNKTLKEAVESATTVADILDIMEAVPPADAVEIKPIVFRNGTPCWDAEYMADGASLSIEWIDIEPDGEGLVGRVHVRNPLYNQGVTDETAAYMILMAYKMKKQEQEWAASSSGPGPEDYEPEDYEPEDCELPF